VCYNIFRPCILKRKYIFIAGITKSPAKSNFSQSYYSSFKTTPWHPGHRGVANPWCPGGEGVVNPWSPGYRGVATCLPLGYQGVENRLVNPWCPGYRGSCNLTSSRIPGSRESLVSRIPGSRESPVSRIQGVANPQCPGHLKDFFFTVHCFFRGQAIATAFKATINQKPWKSII